MRYAVVVYTASNDRLQFAIHGAN